MSMSQPYNEDDVAWAKKMLAQNLATAVDVAQKFVDTCRDDNPQAAAYMAKQLHEADTADMLMLVIGQLTMRVVNTERRAEEAHGPLLTADEVGLTQEQMKPHVFQTAIHDQMQAALDEKDYQLYAQIMVDGLVRSLVAGFDAGEELEWGSLVRTVMLISQDSLTLATAEMALRLTKQELERRQA